ncbi:MAG: polyprenyl synthetase family protein, partial [Ginsengibacter sp.]
MNETDLMKENYSKNSDQPIPLASVSATNDRHENAGQTKNCLHSFKELYGLFEERFKGRHFPAQPEQLYDASQYLLTLGGKRIRPVMCLMGNEMFGEIKEDAYYVASAIELFHNFTLIHDDIMDHAPLRRGMPTAHTRYGESTAL